MRCQFDSRRTEIQRNLLKLYRERTESDDTLGRAWYPAAHRIVIEWADHYGYSIATVACVIAAISPQCPWPRNLIIADDIMADRVPSIGALKSNVRKAQRIREGRATDITQYFPRGPKVASFAVNLAGDYSHITVDTHAMQAALCDVEARYALPWTPYAIFAECYRGAATVVQEEPATFQAIIWHLWKRLYPPALKRNRRRQWEPVGELE